MLVTRTRPLVSAERAFSFTLHDFEQVRELLYRHAGIVLADSKRDMVYNRLVRVIRELKLAGFAEYLVCLQEHPEALQGFINAMTTNLTAFFREPHHFDYLADQLLPELDRQGQRRLRIWSAGCAIGEEAYSIAMTVLGSRFAGADRDVRILATDIDTRVLDVAQQGIYAAERVATLPEAVRRRWFLRGVGASAGQVRVRDELRALLTFRELNLMRPWPMTGPLDVIFCRNVMIYFDQQTQQRLLQRMADLLRPGGLLFVGHSETPGRLTDRFRLVGNTVYRRCR